MQSALQSWQIVACCEPISDSTSMMNLQIEQGACAFMCLGSGPGRHVTIDRHAEDVRFPAGKSFQMLPAEESCLLLPSHYRVGLHTEDVEENLTLVRVILVQWQQ